MPLKQFALCCLKKQKLVSGTRQYWADYEKRGSWLWVWARRLPPWGETQVYRLALVSQTLIIKGMLPSQTWVHSPATQQSQSTDARLW